MEACKKRIYRLDSDELEVQSWLDQQSGLWIEEYIDFENVPRYTPNGRRWQSVTRVGCPYADPVLQDCGTCPNLKKENTADLIGVCFREELRLNSNE